MKTLPTTIALGMLAATACAQGTVRGTIQISRKLTRHGVTSSIPLYQRGTTVRLGNDAESDPLALERSHVVVYLEGALTGADGSGKAAPFVMQQVDRQFAPDLLAVPAGAAVSFPNMDPIFHNVFSLSSPKTFDLGSYDKGDSRNVTFAKPGQVAVYCHLHPNMTATIFVTPNRWYARADRTGHYVIRDVPAGRYTIVAWHKAAGSFRQGIVIGPDGEVTADFVLPFTEASQPPPMVMPGGQKMMAQQDGAK